HFNSIDVFNLTTQDVMKFQNKKLKEGHSWEYLKKMHVFLVSLLNHAMKYHDLKSNVASLVGNFEIESNKRLNYWTLDQFNQFYEVLPTIE
ncbi:site-specific integrase, partial [Staphylococcus warneri]